jgi:PAS domain S-box-containing protein
MKQDASKQEQLLIEIEDLRARLGKAERRSSQMRQRKEILKRSEQEKSSILDSLQEAVTYLDMEMRVLWANKTATESAGLRLEEIVGRFCYAIWCKRREPCPYCPALQTIKTGQVKEGEIATPDGKIWLHRSYPNLDARGNIINMVLMTLDITERKRVEESLQRSENAYRTLSENLPGMVYRVFIRENSRMHFFNSMLQVMTGYVAEELSAGEVCSIEPLIVSDDRTAVVSKVKQAILNNQPFEVEYRLRSKGGEIRYFLERGRPIYGNDGEPLYVDGVILDISERKKAEEALKKSEERFKLIASNTPDHILIQDADLRYVTVINPQLGLTEKEMVGKTDYEILEREDAEKLTKIKNKVIQTGEPEYVNSSVVDRKGGKQYFEGAYIPWRNANGRIDGLIGYFRNMTERKRAEENILKLNTDLVQRARDLENANQELDAFASMASHDLKNQLAVFAGLIGRLGKQRDKLDDKGQRYLTLLKDSVGATFLLIDKLLEMSRASRKPLEMEKVDLSELARSILRKYREKDRDRDVSLVIPKRMETAGDRRLLEVVLENLLGNAWKFTKHSQPAWIELGVMNEGDAPVFFVRDNGCGFDQSAYKDKVFLPFQRFHPGDEYAGTGIGLATVKRVLDRHAGRIWAESEVGKGTTFYFSISNVSS